MVCQFLPHFPHLPQIPSDCIGTSLFSGSSEFCLGRHLNCCRESKPSGKHKWLGRSCTAETVIQLIQLRATASHHSKSPLCHYVCLRHLRFTKAAKDSKQEAAARKKLAAKMSVTWDIDAIWCSSMQFIEVENGVENGVEDGRGW